MTYLKTKMEDFIKDNDRIVLSPKPIYKLKTTKQDGGMKPKGLWYGFGDSWLNFLKYRWEDKLDYYNYAYKLKLDTSNILVLKTLDDIEDFISKYQISSNVINNRKLANDYYGMEIPNYDDLGVRFSMNFNHLWLSTWDVPSGCVWNENAKYELIELKDFYKK